MQTPNRDNRANRLGRGLSALLPNASAATAPVEPARPQSGVLQVAIENIVPDKKQPRQNFDDERIEELAASIKAKGVIQPILVRRDGEKFRIIAGERRWRAAGRAGLKTVPALVKEVSERQAFELALIENIQRADLNPVEEAEAFRRLIEEHQLTQEACAERLGKDRSVIANALRLLRLPDEVKTALAAGSLAMGHARALLGLGDDEAIKKASAQVIERGLSVRETEKLVRKAKGGSRPGGKTEGKDGEEAPASPQVRSLEEQLQRALGTRVKLLDKGGGKGRIEIEFFNHEELDRLLARLLGASRSA
jgi:ParB family chromosome partitioning protein